MGHRRYVRDSPKDGGKIPCHLIFHGKEFDIEKIRSLAVILNTTQLVDKINIVDGYSEKEIAEIIKGVISEDGTLVKKEDAETNTDDQVSKNSFITEGHEMSSMKQAAALGSEDTAENPKTYSKSWDNATNVITRDIGTSYRPQSSMQCMSYPNTSISPLGLVQKVLKSPESEGYSEGEPLITVDVDNAASCATSKSKVLETSEFYVKEGKVILIQR